MVRLCPVCGSAETGGYPKRPRQYTERGRLDVDDWHCHPCGASWEIWDYVREDVEEIKEVRLKDGRIWTPDNGVQGTVPGCPYCRSKTVEFVQSDGRWVRGGANVLRYTCSDCRAIWQWIMADDGKRLFKRLWRKGWIL